MTDTWADPNFPVKPSVLLDCEDGVIDLSGLAEPGDVYTVHEVDGIVLLTPVLGPKNEEWYAEYI